MDADALSALVLAGFALAGSPGPNTLSLAAAGAAFGARRAFGYMLGLAAGMLVVMLIVASGLVAMLLALPGVAPVATGALLYFVYLAWRIATAPPLREAGADRRVPGPRDGVLLSLVNPKGYAAMLALFSGRAVLPDRLLGDAALKIAVALAIILLVNVVWLHAGAGLARLFRSPRAGRVVNVVFAVSLLVSAVMLIPR